MMDVGGGPRQDVVDAHQFVVELAVQRGQGFLAFEVRGDLIGQRQCGPAGRNRTTQCRQVRDWPMVRANVVLPPWLGPVITKIRSAPSRRKSLHTTVLPSRIALTASARSKASSAPYCTRGRR